jgi:hypothetical protein
LQNQTGKARKAKRGINVLIDILMNRFHTPLHVTKR